MNTVLITGANKGIGFETAKQLAEMGYFVFIGSRNKQNSFDALHKLKSLGLTNVDSVKIDVADIDSIKSAKEKLASKIPHLDILINNAGIAGEQPQSFSTTDLKNLREVFYCNFFGAVQTTQIFLDLLKKSDAPVVLNVSSEVGSLTLHTAADKNSNWDNYAVYGASKTALNAFTIMLANEFKDTDFRINSVSPGYTATDLNNHKGTKTVAEGAKSIVMAATLSDKSTGKFFKDGEEMPW